MQRIVAIDTETGGLDWFDPEQQAFMATWSWADEDRDWMVDIDHPAAAQLIDSHLRLADVIVCHNLKFDAHQLRATWGIDLLDYEAELHDTDLLSRVVQPEGQRKNARGGHGLKNLATVMLKADAQAEEDAIKEAAKSIGLKTLRKQGAYYKVWRAYPELMEAYAKADTRYTVQIFELLMRKLAEHPNQRLRDVYELERAVLPIFVRMEQRGVRLDPEAVRKLRTKYRRQAKRLYNELAAELGEACLTKEVAHEEDTTVADALREALLKHGVPLYEKTDTGLLSTNKFALQEFEDQFPILSSLREWRKVSKFLATYIDPMHGRDVVHASFFQLGAWTSRASCSRPNMQNVPKDEGGARTMFIPREGYVLGACDFASIEAFLAAHYFGDERYREIVAKRDPHAWLTSIVEHGDEAHVEAYLKGTAGAKRREEVKNVTYAILYGAGGPRVSAMLQIPLTEAKALISRVKAALPGFYRLNKRIKSKVKAVGYVNTSMGRELPVGKNKSYVGLNAIIQGTAADIMKQAMVCAQEHFDLNPHWDAHILLVVHDELVWEGLAEHAEEIQAAVLDAMESAGYRFKPPIKAEGKYVTTNYGDAK